MKDLITEDVFEMFPGFVRAVVVAHDLHIKDENARISTFLTDAQDDCDLVKMEGRLSLWDDAHVQFGSNPKRFPPSLRSLTERVRRAKPLPLINEAVGIMNAISLKFGVPVGGDDLAMIVGDLCLGRATGQELFIPLGTDQVEHPIPGEIIYFDTADNKVLCRRWNWRNGDQTKIMVDTHDMLINIDGLGDSAQATVEKAAVELSDWLAAECLATVRLDLLSFDHRMISI